MLRAKLAKQNTGHRPKQFFNFNCVQGIIDAPWALSAITVIASSLGFIDLELYQAYIIRIMEVMSELKVQA